MPALKRAYDSTVDFRLLFESAPGLYLVLTPSLIIVAVTNTYLEATLTKRENILGKYIFDVFPSNPTEGRKTGAGNLQYSLEKVVRTGLPDVMAVQKYDIPRPASQGGGFEERYWNPANYPVFDNNGILSLIIHNVKDVTEYFALKNPLLLNTVGSKDADELKSLSKEELDLTIIDQKQELKLLNAQLYHTNQNLQEEILARQEAEASIRKLNIDLQMRASQLEASNKELESFSYSVSHDLRAPLRAIDGFARMLEEDYAALLNEEGQRKLKIIRDNSKNMGQLIDDLLMLSRFGKKELAYINLPMAALVQKAYDENIGSNRSFRLIIHELPQAYGDPILIQQVWINLISNAIKFSTLHECPQIEVGGYIEDKEAVYYVQDNGAGFDMRYYNKLFGVFQRLHRIEEFEGTGVGLAIVQRIIQRHHGRIWAKSKVGEGAIFYFALPKQEVVSESA